MKRAFILLSALFLAISSYSHNLCDTLYISEDSLAVNTKGQLIKDSIVVTEKQKHGSSRVYSESSEIMSLRKELFQKDSIILAQKKIIDRNASHLAFADSVILRLANDCFRFKYSKENVDKAKTYFVQMYSVHLQQQFSPLLNLLNKYEVYYNEIIDVLRITQNSYNTNNRAWKNPFKNAQSPNRFYLNKLKNTNYYRIAYKQDWSIYYLDELIDKAINQIEVFDSNPKESELKLLELL